MKTSRTTQTALELAWWLNQRIFWSEHWYIWCLCTVCWVTMQLLRMCINTLHYTCVCLALLEISWTSELTAVSSTRWGTRGMDMCSCNTMRIYPYYLFYSRQTMFDNKWSIIFNLPKTKWEVHKCYELTKTMIAMIFVVCGWWTQLYLLNRLLHVLAAPLESPAVSSSKNSFICITILCFIQNDTQELIFQMKL